MSSQVKISAGRTFTRTEIRARRFDPSALTETWSEFVIRTAREDLARQERIAIPLTADCRVEDPGVLPDSITVVFTWMETALDET